MHRPSYALSRAMVRFVSGMYLRHRIVHAERLRRPGPFVLACTHIGHLEPAILGAWMQRPVHWVAREEFFRFGPAARLLRRLGAIRVDRRGVPVSAIRESVRRLHHGEIVGIFPEGGRTHGDDQAIHGGEIKGGACLIALRAGVPIVPVVMLGTDRLQTIHPWIPGQRTTITTLIGSPITPATIDNKNLFRQARRDMTAQLANAFVDLYASHQKNLGRPA
ncbi:MAG: lysophospholipid acyltransferase family protein [Tepidisphaeraceae bacterium]